MAKNTCPQGSMSSVSTVGWGQFTVNKALIALRSTDPNGELKMPLYALIASASGGLFSEVMTNFHIRTFYAWTSGFETWW
jgi:hypothetical protein